MIDLTWFEQFSEFKSFHFMVRNNDDKTLFCSCLFFDYVDAYTFISACLNVNYSVVDFDFSIRHENFAIVISVEAV